MAHLQFTDVQDRPTEFLIFPFREFSQDRRWFASSPS